MPRTQRREQGMRNRDQERSACSLFPIQWLGWGPISEGFADGEGVGAVMLPCGLVPGILAVAVDSTRHLSPSLRNR